jgi:membrane associated rhomboid family serine protease
MFPIHDDTPRIHGRPFVNYGLIAVNIVVFIYEAIVTSNFSNYSATNNLFYNYGSVPNLLLSGQNLGSLFTSMFMHGGIAHLIGNMFFLYVFGDNLEDRFGRVKYLLIYLLWGIAASLTHSLYAVSTGDGNTPAIGASGAISGVMGAYLLFFPHAKIHTLIFAFFITTVRIPALAYIPFWFILQLIFALIGQSGGVAYLAHIGGFLAGVATAFVWKYTGHLVSQFSGPNRSSSTPVTTYRVNPYRQSPQKSDVINKDMPPEIITGNGFVDVIIEAYNVHMDSNVQAKFEPVSNILTVSVVDLDKSYSVPISNPNGSNYYVSTVSVLNGVIKIRLQRK